MSEERGGPRGDRSRSGQGGYGSRGGQRGGFSRNNGRRGGSSERGYGSRQDRGERSYGSRRESGERRERGRSWSNDDRARGASRDGRAGGWRESREERGFRGGEDRRSYRGERRDGASSFDKRRSENSNGRRFDGERGGYNRGRAADGEFRGARRDGGFRSERGGRSDRAGASRGRGDFARGTRGGRSSGPRNEEQRPGLTEQEQRERELRFVRHEHKDPEIPDSITENDLPFAARVELKTLTKENAEFVARHLAMVALLIDSDPELAHQHAISASRKGGRIAICRETLAITAYTTGDYALALRELRTYRRISGKDDQLALMIDSERGLGRADRALELGRSADRSSMPAAQRVNVAIAMSGARLDLGQADLALAELEVPELDDRRAFSFSPALFDAYAEVLEELGRADEAKRWRRASERAAAALEAAEHDEHETMTIVTETLDGEPYEERLVDVPVDEDSAQENDSLATDEADTSEQPDSADSDAGAEAEAEAEAAGEAISGAAAAPIVDSDADAPAEASVQASAETVSEAPADTEPAPSSDDEQPQEMTLAFDFDFDEEDTNKN